VEEIRKNNRKFLIEKDGIRAACLAYFRIISRYRSDWRPVIYTDETYSHPTHAKYDWSDCTSAGVLAPVFKGQRATIVVLAVKMATLGMLS